ncbi:MAG: BadF/BadG/BcrA/BcrD ATPase family protein [Candidatus Sulfotelmatobacter sp.]
MPYFLGIDGGGTKTLCALGDDSKLLATATAGPSNVLRVGEAQARESLHQSVRQTCAAAGITPPQVSKTCIGAAGAARPEVAETVRRILAEILPSTNLPATIKVVGDMQIALEAAFGAGPGVLVIAGTGSIAYGRDLKGHTARAGGWGFAISDEGSAHWIGRAAAAALVRDMDRTETIRTEIARTDGDSKSRAALQASPLAAALLKAWDATTLEDFARAPASANPPDFAALFPAVLASSEDSATQILASAGAELAHLASVVICRLFPPSRTSAPNVAASAASVPVAMAGGVFRHAALVRQVFYNQVRWLDPGVQVQPEIVEPVEGALRLARQM